MPTLFSFMGSLNFISWVIFVERLSQMLLTIDNKITSNLLLIYSLPIILFSFVMPLWSNLFNIRIVLTCFEDLIGMKENLSKSEVVLVGEVGDKLLWLGRSI